MTTFTVASNEFLGGGKEKAECHAIVRGIDVHVVVFAEPPLRPIDEAEA
jgi:hypothetical protein